MKRFILILAVMFLMNGYISSAFAEILSLKLGDMEIFSLLDAQSEAPVNLLIGASEEQIEKYIPNGKLKNQILAYLVKFPDRKILFDTGLGESKGGKIMSVLRELEISPSEIDSIFITHMHPDHIGGLIDGNGEAVFTRADIYVSRIEKEWWFDEQKDENVRKTFEPYKDRMKIFEFDEMLMPFIKAIDTSGHTPGHTAFHVTSEGGEILIVGDVLHFGEIMLNVPDIAVVYDVDPSKAPISRRFILDMAAEKNIPIAGMHFPIPGLWKIEKDGKGYKIISPK